MSRVDTKVDRRLDKIGTGRAAALRGKAAIANARLAYQRYEESVSTDRWKSLAAAGASPQRPLWASTSVKDPAYEDTRYVTGLVAPDVVDTMPKATLNAVADHGRIPDDSIHGTYNQSRDALGELAAIGIDYHDVVQVLEDQGVGAFRASWDRLGQGSLPRCTLGGQHAVTSPPGKRDSSQEGGPAPWRGRARSSSSCPSPYRWYIAGIALPYQTVSGKGWAARLTVRSYQRSDPANPAAVQTQGQTTKP